MAITIQTKQEIITHLNLAFDELIKFLGDISEQQFGKAPESKWPASQQLVHLIRSTKPIAHLLQGDIAHVEAFGKLEREAWDYHTLVQNYLNLLSTGAKATGSFVPKEVDTKEKRALIDKFSEATKALLQALNHWDEDQLDAYCIPHPLMGNFSVREMLFFTIYHTQHHFKFIKEYAGLTD